MVRPRMKRWNVLRFKRDAEAAYRYIELSNIYE